MKARKPLTTIVGACLAAVAAGCLVLFSLLAQNFTLGVSDGGAGMKVATPEETSSVISLPGRSGSGSDTRTGGDGRGTDNPVTGPLALLVEPLAPGDSLAELVGPGSEPGSTTSSAGSGNSGGGGGDRVAAAPDRFGGGPRTTLDTSARAVRTAILVLRAQDRGTGRPAPGDGGSGRAGKSDKGKKGKGHAKATGRAGKDVSKGKSKSGRAKGKAPKTNRSKGGGHRTSSAAPTAKKARAPSHSSGPPAHSKSKSKAPKPAPAAPKKTPPGHAKGGPPGKAKGKKS